MLWKVNVGRDQYLGTPEEVVSFMAKAKGAPPGGPAAFMRGVAKRLERGGRGAPVDVSDAAAFLASLAAAGVLTIEERPEASRERVAPSDALGDGPIAYGKDVDPDELDLEGLE
jgi:hypothetical protein